MPSDSTFEFGADVLLLKLNIRGKIEKLHCILRGQDERSAFTHSLATERNL